MKSHHLLKNGLSPMDIYYEFQKEALKFPIVRLWECPLAFSGHSTVKRMNDIPLGNKLKPIRSQKPAIRGNN